MAQTTAGISFSLTDEQKEYKELARSFAAFRITEPGAGSDVSAIQTSAKLSDDGTYYTLNGSKTFITNAELATFITVFAMTDPSKGHRGLTAFIVDVRDTEGNELEGF